MDYTLEDPFKWEIVGRNLFAMFVCGIGYFIFTILVQYKFFIKSRYDPFFSCIVSACECFVVFPSHEVGKMIFLRKGISVLQMCSTFCLPIMAIKSTSLTKLVSSIAQGCQTHFDPGDHMRHNIT